MKSTLNNVLIFTVGAAIGSAVTWYFVKTKYERIVQEEIDSVKNEFSRHRYTSPNDADEAAEVEQDDVPEEEEYTPATPAEKQEYGEIVQKLGYHNYSDVEPVHIEKKEVQDMNGPKVITPDEFGEVGYKTVDLTYWADGVLTDGKNKRIQDVDALIGKGTIDQFGKYEDDALHVRDDKKKIDFEILRDLKKYYDFFDDDPHKAEEE